MSKSTEAKWANYVSGTENYKRGAKDRNDELEYEAKTTMSLWAKLGRHIGSYPAPKSVAAQMKKAKSLRDNHHPKLHTAVIGGDEGTWIRFDENGSPYVVDAE